MARRSRDAQHDSFAGFTEVTEIGGGAASTVYRARELDSGRTVALVVHSGTDLRPHAAEAFEREWPALRALSGHPHIVTLYGTFRAPDGVPVLVQELCRGSVVDRMQGRGLPVAEVVSVGVKMAGALEAAHRVGIVHGEVSPRNILVTDGGEPALADLGLAPLRPTLRAGQVTAPHTAPELLDGRPATPATDVYGLASTLYELISGRAAFRAAEGESAQSVAQRIRHDPVQPLVSAQIPPALSDALLAALAKDPAERPASAAAFGAELDQVQRRLQSSMWSGAGAAAPATGDDGWSTPSLIGSQQAAEPATAPPVAPPPSPPAPPAGDDSDWSAPSLVGRHAAPEPEPAESPVEPAAAAPGVEPVDDEPPIEMTRRRPLASMSPAFGDASVAAEQAEVAPQVDFLPPPPDADREAPPEVRPPTEVEPAADDPGATRRRPSADELPPPPPAPPAEPTPTPAAAEPPVEDTRRRPPEHTLPGVPDAPRATPPMPPSSVAPPHEVAQGEQVPGPALSPAGTGDDAVGDQPIGVEAPDLTSAGASVPEVPVAAPSREPGPDADALAASLWGASPVEGDAGAPSVGSPDEAPFAEVPLPEPPPAPRQPEPEPPRPLAGPPPEPSRPEEWDPGAVAAALWAPGPSSAGEESGRYPITPESEVPTATGPVPTWVFGLQQQAPQAYSPPSVGDLTLDPASLRRKVTVRSGGSSLTIDETKLVLRHWLRKTELAWTSIRGFEPRLAGIDAAGSGGSLVAITNSGPVELPATRRSMADLRYLHALLDAYRQRALSGPPPG